MNNKQKNQFFGWATLLLAFAFLSSCGDKGDVIRMVRNGVAYEFDVQQTQCSPSVSTTGSAVINSLECQVIYNGAGQLGGTIVLYINSIPTIADQYMNQDIYLSQGAVWATLVEGNFPSAVTGGIVNFSAITNYIGGQVCFTLDATTITVSDLYLDTCGAVVTYGSYL
ncbi:MAG: hypothetical protein R3A11_02320 [Bdellovibrionota bacterium]